jgi:arginase
MKKDIIFLINKSEITAGTRGASLGPGAVMTAARKNNKTFFGDFPIEEVKEMNHLLDKPTVHQFAKRIDGLEVVFNSLNEKVSSILTKDQFPLVIAGDHGSAGGTIAGIKTAYPNKRLGVVWVDAHADLHTPYTTPSGNVHGMPLATAISEDNIPCQSNDVPHDTMTIWNNLKALGGAQKLLPEDLVFIGVRDSEAQEDALMERLDIKNYKVEEVNDKGVDAVLSEIDAKLATCDMIYISFDVDSMDPKDTSHGTGTPVDNGLNPKQAEKILTYFAAHQKTTCIEFVEVNPCLDEKVNKMAEVTANLVEKVVNTLIK